jgi:hypothetical protein
MKPDAAAVQGLACQALRDDDLHFMASGRVGRREPAGEPGGGQGFHRRGHLPARLGLGGQGRVTLHDERPRHRGDRRKVHVRSTGHHEAALGAVFAEVADGFATAAARYPDEQLQAYIAIQGEFNRTALDLTRSIAARQ